MHANVLNYSSFHLYSNSMQTNDALESWQYGRKIENAVALRRAVTSHHSRIEFADPLAFVSTIFLEKD